MPSTAGVRSNFLLLPTLPRPKPLSVCRTRCFAESDSAPASNESCQPFLKLSAISAQPSARQKSARFAVSVEQPGPSIEGHVSCRCDRLNNLFRRQSTKLLDILAAAQFCERVDGRLDQVMRIGRTQPLGQHVTDSRQVRPPRVRRRRR